ncbi:ankyrin repeat domain-containing protein [Clostridium guangxiense]|uniref:ankyrin repeat domain-containing protein n=1 Tax=Clostridium guangxiense TaxID=1662055 RepID=UPI001E49B282|nr:ankyrin repeat domain-containing protein [Clostridium guangxiense]MCD2346247.1 ankyrin repeat domain-containing protein [Clostridium guangxiense]
MLKKILKVTLVLIGIVILVFGCIYFNQVNKAKVKIDAMISDADKMANENDYYGAIDKLKEIPQKFNINYVGLGSIKDDVNDKIKDYTEKESNDTSGENLERAIDHGKKSIVKNLVEKGVDINSKVDGDSVFNYAVKNNCGIDVIKLMIEKGAIVGYDIVDESKDNTVNKVLRDTYDKQEEAKRQAKEKADKAEEERLDSFKDKYPEIGMTYAEVEHSMIGKPNHINTTTTANGKEEQWVYGYSTYIYFKNGIVTAIQN